MKLILLDDIFPAGQFQTDYGVVMPTPAEETLIKTIIAGMGLIVVGLIADYINF